MAKMICEKCGKSHKGKNCKVEVNAASLEALADHVEKLSDIGKAIENSRLKRRTIVLLIKDLTRVDYVDIEKVLDALPMLENKYFK